MSVYNRPGVAVSGPKRTHYHCMHTLLQQNTDSSLLGTCIVNLRFHIMNLRFRSVIARAGFAVGHYIRNYREQEDGRLKA